MLRTSRPFEYRSSRFTVTKIGVTRDAPPLLRRLVMLR